MVIRKLQKTDFDTVLSMMLVFYASDALLVHPSQEVLRKTLTDALADTPYLEAFGFEENGVLAGYGMVAMSYSTEAGGPGSRIFTSSRHTGGKALARAFLPL